MPKFLLKIRSHFKWTENSMWYIAVEPTAMLHLLQLKQQKKMTPCLDKSKLAPDTKLSQAISPRQKVSKAASSKGSLTPSPESWRQLLPHSKQQAQNRIKTEAKANSGLVFEQGLTSEQVEIKTNIIQSRLLISATTICFINLPHLILVITDILEYRKLTK